MIVRYLTHDVIAPVLEGLEFKSHFHGYSLLSSLISLFMSEFVLVSYSNWFFKCET